jgi:hypothetical protein
LAASEPRRRIEQAFCAVVIDAYVDGVSTRSGHRLVGGRLELVGREGTCDWTAPEVFGRRNPTRRAGPGAVLPFRGLEDAPSKPDVD